ncbi:MAG TPA: tetratricopeptide repeat-containing glycosyltransferase family protein [Trinickia sp.]|uniref:tetratricopeptide repeat-containing glycosyltransferase family protein n=1 Tax=Trinickia sp. TaxID=2571163 RepID=UPI002CECC27D|nr:tetratricopeptide repeat-containing glycosyltransferase family protein [Trinickia sp.]HVW53469.1 tetratricopeptide repeat-containing glycosyltransferase family protein [Trinickia sp.]
MNKPGSPRHIDQLLREAVELQQNGALAEAETVYGEILALRPRHFDALQLLGALALQTGRHEEGVAWLSKALEVDPRHAHVHSNLAFALNALGRHDAALAAANRALALKSGFADALNNRGMALAALERPGEALASFEKALSAKPDFPEAWSNRSCALRDLGHPQDAVASCDQAIALRPNYAEAWSNRGNALSDLNRPLEAQASYERALTAASNLADAWNNLGLTYVDMNRHADALACYERALALAPDSAETHWNRALCLLQTGELATGFAEYEWRWRRKRIAPSRRDFDAPLWLGDTPLDGKTILLHAEQGLGDTLQFCRYARLVAAQGARVVLEVQPELTRLLAGLDGVSELVTAGEALPPFDCHSPLLSLPLALHTTIATIPARTPYLLADCAASARFRTRIEEVAGAPSLKVGLVWAGGHRPHVPELRKNDARRSLAYDRFAPIVEVPGVQFFSLQKGENAAHQLSAMRERHEPSQRVIDWTSELTDFADTAALVDNLDLVISVDTSTAHLAGALNKPVWILNRLDTCWRWMLEREDSPWYPSARLFRQPALGDWDSVIESIASALTALAASHGH